MVNKNLDLDLSKLRFADKYYLLAELFFAT